MHNSQSSDSVHSVQEPDASPTQPDQDSVMPPTSPPNHQISPPSPLPAQHLQPSEQDDPSRTPQNHPDPSNDVRPSEVTPDPRPPPTSMPTTSPPLQPKDEAPSVQQPSPQPPTTAPRRQQRPRGRPGRPPNINENSLMRRLECVMAVESGRMSMITACQQYDISARTFYRWLRNKDRLIELTGFTEQDFKDGNPPMTKQAIEMHDAARMPPQRPEQDSNLPRLPNQPAMSAPENRPRDSLPAQTSPNQPFAGAKRRLPKSVQPNRDYASQGDERIASPNTAYYRRNFTKMPPLAHFRDPGAGPSERQAAARNATRMRRDPWHEQPGVEYVRPDDRPFAIQYTDPPPEVFKRRKVVRPQHVAQPDDPADPIIITPSGEQQTPEDSAVEEAPFVNGNSSHHEATERAHVPREGAPPPDAVPYGKTVVVNGARPLREVVVGDVGYNPRAPRKHRIEVMMGRRKVTLAWYDGTAADDIKSSIARRFALLPEAQWALVDHEYDEIVISDGIPSGRYTLTVLS